MVLFILRSLCFGGRYVYIFCRPIFYEALFASGEPCNHFHSCYHELHHFMGLSMVSLSILCRDMVAACGVFLAKKGGELLSVIGSIAIVIFFHSDKLYHFTLIPLVLLSGIRRDMVAPLSVFLATTAYGKSLFIFWCDIDSRFSQL